MTSSNRGRRCLIRVASLNADRPTIFAQHDVAGPQEELPILKQERARLIDESPLEGFRGLTKLLSPDVGVGDRLKGREALVVASGVR